MAPHDYLQLALHFLTIGRSFLPDRVNTAKLLLGTLLLANIRSFPFAWHARVFRPSFIIWARYRWIQLRCLLLSKQGKLLAEDRFMDTMAHVGANPFGYMREYATWASLDESDWNMHLSNSSYPKVMDAARANATRPAFMMFYRAGGKMALAATHFSFIREIPILTSYEVRVSFAAWDRKWLYVVAKFVTKPTETPKPTGTRPSEAKTTHTSITFPPTPASPSGSATPVSKISPEATLQGVASTLLAQNTSAGPWTEPDGAIVHTVAVSQCCFKLGRITVPPAIVFAINGFSAPSSPETISFHRNPPPHWNEHVKPLMSPLHGGSQEKLRWFLSGGWKEIPENERWWEHAMGVGLQEKDPRIVTEEQRSRGLAVVGRLPDGLGGLRRL